MSTTSDIFQIQMFPEPINMHTESCLICLKHEIMTICFWSRKLPRDDKKAGRCVGSHHEKHAVRMSLRCHWQCSASYRSEKVFLLTTMMILFRKIYLNNCDCKELLKIVRAPHEKADEKNKEWNNEQSGRPPHLVSWSITDSYFVPIFSINPFTKFPKNRIHMIEIDWFIVVVVWRHTFKYCGLGWLSLVPRETQFY